jgi:hypothetical protein
LCLIVNNNDPPHAPKLRKRIDAASVHFKGKTQGTKIKNCNEYNLRHKKKRGVKENNQKNAITPSKVS